MLNGIRHQEGMGEVMTLHIHRVSSLLLALALVVAVTVAGLWVVVTAAWHHPPANIEEDDPRWNCSTMGNQICGEGR